MSNVLQTREDVCILTDIRESHHKPNPCELGLSPAATGTGLGESESMSLYEPASFYHATSVLTSAASLTLSLHGVS